MEEVTDEPLYRDRVCGIDIGKAGLVATIRVPSDKNPARRAAETRSFGTTKREVLALADWLRCWQVPAVVMEATGVIRGRDRASATEADGTVLPVSGLSQTGYLRCVRDGRSRPLAPGGGCSRTGGA